MNSLTKALLLVILLYGALIVSARPSQINANPGGRVLGFVKSDFTPIAHETPIGTSVRIDFSRVLIDHASKHEYQMKQDTKALSGKTSKDIYSILGMRSVDATSKTIGGPGSTHVQPFVYILTGSSKVVYEELAGASSVHLNSRTAKNHAFLQLRLCQGDDCVCGEESVGSSEGCTKYKWQAAYIGPRTGLFNTRSFNFTASDDPPVEVVGAKVGHYTLDNDYAHDVHLESFEHRYYAARCEKSAGWWSCKGFGAWGGSSGPWPAIQSHVDGTDVQAYKDSTDIGRWHHCMGKSPGSKCGCTECPPPAFGPNSQHSQRNLNENWIPENELPIGICIHPFPSDRTAWKATLQAVVDDWNADLGVEYLKIVSRFGGNCAIKIKSDPQLQAFGQERKHAAVVRSTSSWQCASNGGKTAYESETKSEIHISTDPRVVEWTDENVFTTSDMRPWAGNSLRWRYITMRHEVGHALGIDHYGGCPALPPQATPVSGPTPTPTPGPPPTAVPYGVMCAPAPGKNYKDVRLNIVVPNDVTTAAKCLFYRR